MNSQWPAGETWFKQTNVHMGTLIALTRYTCECVYDLWEVAFIIQDDQDPIWSLAD